MAAEPGAVHVKLQISADLDALRRCANIAQPPGIFFGLRQKQINVAQNCRQNADALRTPVSRP